MYMRPELYESKMCKARKEHRCLECLKVIKKGSVYENVNGLWDGDFDNYKTCSRCVSIRDAITKDWPADEVGHGDLMEIFKERQDSRRAYRERDRKRERLTAPAQNDLKEN